MRARSRDVVQTWLDRMKLPSQSVSGTVRVMPIFQNRLVKGKASAFLAIAERGPERACGQHGIVVGIAEAGAWRRHQRPSGRLLGHARPSEIDRIGAVAGRVAVKPARHPHQLVGRDLGPGIAGAPPLRN